MEDFWDFLHELLPGWYIWIGIVYAGVLFVRAFWHDLELIITATLRILWTTLALPVLLAFIWPVSMLMHIAHLIWGLHHFWLFRQLYGGYWHKTWDDENSHRRREHDD